MSYTNYINNKMHHNDRYVTTDGYPCKLSKVKKTKTTNYEIYGNNGRNWLPYPYYETTKTESGVTFTDNGDGTITANGTATDNTGFYCSANTPKRAVNFPAGSSYRLGGCPAGGSFSSYRINFALKNSADSSWTYDVSDYGNGLYPSSSLFTNKVIDRCYVRIVISKGTVCNNLVFKPQVEVFPAGMATVNLLPTTAVDGSTKTENGITFTDNHSTGNRRVTIKGTATADAEFVIANWTVAKTAVYYMDVPNSNATENNYYLQANMIKDGEIIRTEKTSNYGAYVNAINHDCDTIQVKLVVKSGVTVNNVACDCIFKLLRHDYEPYQLMGEKSKNLLKLPYAVTTSTINGVTWSADPDGRVHAEGTATGHTYLTVYSGAVPKHDKVAFGFYGDSGNLAMQLMLRNKDDELIYSIDTFIDPEIRFNTADISPYTTATKLVITMKRYKDTTTGYPDTTYCDGYPILCEGTKIPDEYEPIDKYKMPIINEGKNIINIDKMLNANLVKNSDGTYTITKNGSGKRSSLEFIFDVPIKRGSKITASCELVDYNGTYFRPLQCSYGGSNEVGLHVGSVFGVSESGTSFIANLDIKSIYIYQEGSQPDGTYTKFKNLQIEYGGKKTEYEPYRAPTTSNIWLDKQISRYDSVSTKSDNLPQLPLVKGTNVLSSTASIVPSNMRVKYTAKQ